MVRPKAQPTHFAKLFMRNYFAFSNSRLGVASGVVISMTRHAQPHTGLMGTTGAHIQRNSRNKRNQHTQLSPAALHRVSAAPMSLVFWLPGVTPGFGFLVSGFVLRSWGSEPRQCWIRVAPMLDLVLYHCCCVQTNILPVDDAGHVGEFVSVS